MATNSVSGTNAGSGAAAAAASSKSKSSVDDTADRFLKLLVTQIQNQDPLNPMDNAQVTTQMAQINTVNGIEKLNTTVAKLGTQFAQLQLMQGASLVGHQVTVPGDTVAIADGVGEGGFELASPADRVKVEILGASGHVIDTLQLGAMSSGRQDFSWQAPNVSADAGIRFRVTATSGATAVTATPLTRDKVDAVSADGDTLDLELSRGGTVTWSDVRAFN